MAAVEGTATDGASSSGRAVGNRAVFRYATEVAAFVPHAGEHRASIQKPRCCPGRRASAGRPRHRAPSRSTERRAPVRRRASPLLALECCAGPRPPRERSGRAFQVQGKIENHCTFFPLHRWIVDLPEPKEELNPNITGPTTCRQRQLESSDYYPSRTS